MSKDPLYEADRARYPSHAFIREQSLWAVWIYRFGRRNLNLKPGVFRSLRTKIYWLLFRFVETLTGISLPAETSIGAGLRIYHFGNIFVHPDAVIGKNCTLRQGITIGNRTDGGALPVIGDNVELGAYAQILGNVKIGDGAKIGAMSLVLCDVPAGATAVGNPARVISKVAG